MIRKVISNNGLTTFHSLRTERTSSNFQRHISDSSFSETICFFRQVGDYLLLFIEKNCRRDLLWPSATTTPKLPSYEPERLSVSRWSRIRCFDYKRGPLLSADLRSPTPNSNRCSLAPGPISHRKEHHRRSLRAAER